MKKNPSYDLFKHAVLLLPLLFHCHTSPAQYDVLNKDSLKRLLALMPADTAKVKTLIRLGEQYNFFIPDSGTYYYMQANQLSEQLHYMEGRVCFIHDYTEILNTQLKHDESLQLNLEALALCEQYGLKEELRIQSLLHTGVVYLYKENYRAAAEYFLKALPLIEHSGDLVGLSEVYRHLSVLYRYLKQPEKALAYGHSALTCAEKSGEPLSISMDCNNLGMVLSDLRQTAAATYYLNKAYALGKKMNDKWAQITALIARGKLLYKTGAAPALYLPVYQNALSLATIFKDRIGQSEASYGIALGLYRKKQYVQAAKYAKASLAISGSVNHKESAKEALLLLSDIQIASGNLAEAAAYRNAYDSVATLLTNVELQKNVQELEARYRLEKTQSAILKQNLLLAQKAREAFRQRTWLAASVAGLLCLCLLLLGINRYYRQRQLLSSQAMAAMQAEQENLRLKALLEGQLSERQRISQEMHDDMGSGLTSMLFLSRTIQGQEVVASKLKRTAQELLQKMNEIIWTMNPEQNTLDSMVAYMRLHLAEALENAGLPYQFTVTDPLPAVSLSQEFRRNMYLASKEAVHNIIRHAQATSVTIHIAATQELQILVQDNGIGLNSNHTRFGNGMKNMQHRMEQLKGSFTAQSGKGTCITLRAPLPVV